MPGTNLTREEASERAAVVSTETYDVELDLTIDSETRFGSVTTITFGAPSGAPGRTGHHGSESSYVRPIFPSNGWLIRPPRWRSPDNVERGAANVDLGQFRSFYDLK